MTLDFKRFRQIFEYAPLGIFLTTREGHFIDLNERLAAILGYNSVEELRVQIKNVATDLYVNTDDRKNMIALIDAEKGIVVKEIPFKKKNSQIIFVRLSISSFSEIKNEKVTFIGMVEDISEKRMLEKKLSVRENLLTKIVNSLPFELWVLDCHGEVLSQSGFSQEKRGSYVGQDFKSFSLLENWKLNLFFQRVWEGECIDIEETYEEEGKTIFTRELFIPLFDDGRINGVIVISLDQTEKVMAQKRVLEIQQLLETVINGIPVRVFWKNIDLQFMGANASFLMDFKMDSELVLRGKTDYDLLSRNDAEFLEKLNHEVINLGQPILNHKVWLTSPEQKEVCIVTSLIPCFSNLNSEVTGIFVCYQDITLINRMEEELQLHREELEKLVEIRTGELHQVNVALVNSNEALKVVNETLKNQKTALSETLNQLKITQDKLIQSEKMASLRTISAGIAHEINNPLNFIYGGTQGIDLVVQEMNAMLSEFPSGAEMHDAGKTEKLKGLFDDMKQITASMSNGVERTTKIVNGLRVFSHNAEEKCLSDVHELIELSLALLKNKYENHICIIRKFGTIPRVKCFPGKLRQVFQSLLLNSIQSIRQKGIVEISTALIGEARQIQILIADNGSGIPSEIKNKIFDPFFTTKSVNEGIGLGLFIGHSLIALHEGELNFESEVNKGTIFRISLPID
jgi:PAS domain S-box-containing protein